jgi:hypothetical protein
LMMPVVVKNTATATVSAMKDSLRLRRPSRDGVTLMGSLNIGVFDSI